MGNSLVLCTSEIKSKETLLIKNSNILQIMKIDGKILEFRNPILVKDLLQNHINCYVAMFKDATQPLPLNYKLNKGRVYYLLPCLNHQSLDNTTINNDNAHVDEASRKPSRKSTRIKVVISREKLKELLKSQDNQRVEELIVGSVSCNNNTRVSCNSSASSTWMPRLESIPEGGDIVC